MLSYRVGFLTTLEPAVSTTTRELRFIPVSPEGGWCATNAGDLIRISFVQMRKEADMNGPKHEKAGRAFRNDLEHNPGIGQSKGSFATGIPPEEIEGENTSEGDVENDTTMTDRVSRR
jgi:hypothetical protein